MRRGPVVFAEGSHHVDARGRDDFALLWDTAIPDVLALPKPRKVIPFSKGHFLAWLGHPAALREPFDQLFATHVDADDTAVVVWDAKPEWDKEQPSSRWDETVKFHELMAQSNHVPRAFKDFCKRRFAELKQRTPPCRAPQLPAPAPGTVWAACVDPEFEAALGGQATARQVLGVRGQMPAARGTDPEEQLESWVRWALSEGKQKAKPPFHLSFAEAKHRWAREFLRTERGAAAFKSHNLGTRLCQVWR